MKITLADPSHLESLLSYLQERCIAYTDDDPWTITVLPHEELDASGVLGLVAAWMTGDAPGRVAVED